MAASLLKRVKAHATGQATSGQNTLSLFVESIEHGFEHNDFTPLVALVALSQPAQSRNVRALSGKVLEGYNIVKSEKADFGLVVRKVKGSNQGCNEAELNKVRAMVADKKSVQSEAVKAVLKGSTDKADFVARDQEKLDKSAVAWAAKHGDDELQQKILDAQRMVIAFQKAAENKGKAQAI